MLKTPVMDLTQVTDPKLSFYYKKNGSYDFSVYVSTDGGETYTTPLAEGLATASSWTQKTIALENLDSYDQVVIVFKGTGSYSYYSSYYYYLDDVEVGGIPTCNKPIAVSVPDSSLTANSAIVHWVDTNATAPESYTVSYTDGENTYTVTSQDTTVTLPSLTFCSSASAAHNSVIGLVMLTMIHDNCLDDSFDRCLLLYRYTPISISTKIMIICFCTIQILILQLFQKHFLHL